MNLNDIASFVAVVEYGTITGAARAEGVPKSTISRRISRLEGALGVQLLTRAPRSFTVTEAGYELHARAKGALLELQDVRLSLMEDQKEPRGTLVLTASHDLSRAPFLGRLLALYRARYAQVSIEVRLASRFVDLVVEGVDIAIRGHVGKIPGASPLMTRTLGSPTMGFYGARSYLAKRGMPKTPDELKQYDLLTRKMEGPQVLTLASTSGEETISVDAPAFRVNDYGLLHTLMSEGAGIALLPVKSSKEADVVRVLPGWSTRMGKLSLLWPAARFLSPKVRSFIDMATALCEEEFRQV